MSWWSYFGISFISVYTNYNVLSWDCVEIWAVPHILFESHMIVSLSLILSDTGLRLRCQQIASRIRHSMSLVLRPCCEWVWSADRTWRVLSWVHLYCVLVALSLTELTRRNETELPHCNKIVKGGNPCRLCRIMTSQIYAIFYPVSFLGTVFWAVIAVPCSLTKATC